MSKERQINQKESKKMKENMPVMVFLQHARNILIGRGKDSGIPDLNI